MYHLTENTIGAICTPPGDGAVAVIRVSGLDAKKEVDKIFSGCVASYPSHTAHYGNIIDIQGEKVDDVLLLVMHEGRSYTGEETVEIHCHGGWVVTQAVLKIVLSTNVRAALPGEFTYRAFMNGRLDLAQAEAVQQVIKAHSTKAVYAAQDQLSGRLSKKIEDLRSSLLHIAAIVEAWVDFPEEGLEFASFDEVINQLEEMIQVIAHLSLSFDRGRFLAEGVSVCLAGVPNVGKSSLLNGLSQRQKAIVTSIPGTTRDLVQEKISLGGMSIDLVDTAGIRNTEELIEKEGIKRSLEAIQAADCVLFVLDASRPHESLHQEIEAQVANKKVLYVWNKMDLVEKDFKHKLNGPSIRVSCSLDQGLDEIYDALERLIFDGVASSPKEMVITQLRHKEALDEASQACLMAMEGLKTRQSPEFIGIDLKYALASLGRILGLEVEEDLLKAIFSQFCIGK